ncbi:serine hydrolase [Priestia koreensis]|uniref:serine hydrolase n=1 Tax=Priestia koreensis TaxID=284581 RepID=UPI001F579B60|nr:serine hydrolase [Priestia koreensis]UNL87542.1 serine hydrolase [Priestia koreensis]
MLHFKNQITKLIPRNVELGLFLYNFQNDEKIAINENKLLPLASITKLIVACLALQNGTSLNKQVIFDSISIHSNESYNKILSELSIPEINAMFKVENTDLHINSDNRDAINNIGSAQGLYYFLSDMLVGEKLSFKDKKIVLNALKKQQDIDGFRFHDIGTWAHMTGGMDGICNDIGILEIDNQKYFIAGLVKTDDLSINWMTLEKTLQDIGEIIKQVVTVEEK